MSPAVPIAVRAARPADAAAIARVHVASWQAAYRGIVPDAYLDGLDVQDRTGMWSQRLADPAPPMRTLVAEVGADIVGFVTYGPSRDDDAPPETAEIQAIYVDPGAWGAGVGLALMSAAVEALGPAESACSRITLWVLRDNTSARRFYETAGFAADGATTTVTIGDVDLAEVRYARDLPATPPG